MYEELIERLRDAHGGPDGIKMCHQAADAIENLSSQSIRARMLTDLQAELEQVKRERDAAVEHLRDHAGVVSRCWICKNKGDACSGCVGHDIWSDNDHWEWRGVKEG